MKPQMKKNMTAPGDPAGVAAHAIESLRNLADASDLSPIAEMLKAVTEADGCAIALRDGNEVVCRGRAGVAPQLGTRVDPTSGVSGECLRTGNTIRCDDTALDPRLAGSPLRSLIAVAIRGERGNAGVITVLALEPNAFDIMTVVAIKDVAAVISDFREGRIPAEIPEPEPEPEPAAVAGPIPVPAKPAEEPLLTPDPAMQEIRAIFQKTNGKKPIPIPVSPPAAPARAKIAEQVEPSRPEPEIALATLGSYAPAEAEPSALAGVVAALKRAPEVAFANRQRTIAVIAAFIVITAAALWVTLRPKSEPQAEVAVESQTVAGPVVAESTPTAAPPTAAPVQASPKEEPKQTSQQKNKEEEPEPEPEPAPMRIGSGQRVGASPEIQAPTIAGAGVTSVPSMAFGNSSVSYAGPTSKLVPAKIVTMVRPTRPTSFRESDSGSVVVVTATVAVDGQVRKVEVVRGSPHLALAAVSAVRRWRFDPALLNGKPVESKTEVTVKF